MGIFRLPQKIIKFGRGLDEKLKLIFDNGEANPPFISYDENEKTLKFSNDGSTEIPIGSGSGSGSGVNFILNSDFEVNDANVTVSNMTKEISESPHLVGKKSLKLTSVPTNGSADILADVIDVWFVGKALKAVASIRVETGDLGDFRVGIYNDTDDVYVTDLNGATTTNLPNGDTLYSVEFIPAANKVYAIRVTSHGSEASNVAYVDQAFLGEIEQKDMEVINKSHLDTFDVAPNKHYIINMNDATVPKALTMPAGLSKSQIRISVKYDPTTTTKQEVQLTAAGSDKFMVGGVQDTVVTLGEISDWSLFSWDEAGNWVVDDPSNFTSRTLAGNWTVDGTLTAKGRTDGQAVAAGYVGEVISIGYTSPTLNTVGAYTLISTTPVITLKKGTWVFFGVGMSQLGTAPSVLHAVLGNSNVNGNTGNLCVWSTVSGLAVNAFGNAQTMDGSTHKPLILSEDTSFFPHYYTSTSGCGYIIRGFFLRIM